MNEMLFLNKIRTIMMMIMRTLMMIKMVFNEKDEDNYTRDGQRSCHLVSLLNWAALQIK